jgi:hypothetical protein
MLIDNIQFTRKFSVVLVRHDDSVHGMILENIVGVDPHRIQQGWKFVSTAGEVQLAATFNEAQRKAAESLLRSHA